MSEALTVGLNKSERDTLLQGLKYVRSSILLEFREPSTDDSERREKELQNVEQLVAQLNGTQSAKVTANV